MDGMSLLDVLRGVMLDPAEQAVYNADPGAYLGRYGYDGVDPADLSEAFGLVADTLPPDQAQQALAATTAPGDSTFGTVNADFDAGGATGPPTAEPEAGAASIDPSGEAGLDDIDDIDDIDDAGPTLSFGEGEDGGGDLDDPFDDDAADGGHGLGADDPGDDALGLDGLGAGSDHDLGYEGPASDEGIADLDDDLGGRAHDDFDDGVDGGLGGVDDLTGRDGPGGHDPAPGDDFDIGSF